MEIVAVHPKWSRMLARMEEGGGLENNRRAERREPDLSHAARRWQLVAHVQESQAGTGWISRVVGDALQRAAYNVI